MTTKPPTKTPEAKPPEAITVELVFPSDALAALRRAGFLAAGQSSPRAVALAVSALIKTAIQAGVRSPSPLQNGVQSPPPPDPEPQQGEAYYPVPDMPPPPSPYLVPKPASRGVATPDPDAARKAYLERLAKVQGKDDVDEATSTGEASR